MTQKAETQNREKACYKAQEARASYDHEVTSDVF